MRLTRWVSTLTLLTLLGFSGESVAQPVWESTFDSSADGVVDLYDNNAGKVMIGPAVGGNQQITVWDNSTNAYTPDKAGRPLGATVNYNSSFSARYLFSWSALPTASAGSEAYELAGFLGGSSPQTRQVLGTVMRHWNAGGDYYVGLDAAAMGVGFTDFGYRSGPAISLGPNPIGEKFDLRIQFDGTDHLMRLVLRKADGTLMGRHILDLDTDLQGWQNYGPAAFNNETNSIALTHLGWSDYSGYLGDKASVWQVDSLRYYDDGTVPEPSAIGLLAMALAAVFGLRRRAR